MNIQPTPIKTHTTASLMTTITPLVRADSLMPIISSIEIRKTMITAGIFAMPLAMVPSGSATASNGPAMNCAGRLMPKVWSSETTYADQLMETVEEPTAYSSTRSQPMIQAIHSPSVVYAYV